MRDRDRNRRGIDQFVGIHAGQRASRHIAHHVAAGALGRQPNRIQRVYNLRQRFDRQPMELNVLTHRNVCQVPRMLAGNLADFSKLACRDNSVGDPDPHHEPFGRQPFAALATRSAHAVALRVNTPPFEIGRSPLRHHARAPCAGKCANLVKRFPRILLPLQSLHPLGFGFFWRRLRLWFAHLVSLLFRSA